ncbi:hypothetical protein CPC08DRAFT_728791 [Agrocybe pediades]|nr:hypothetical protein CPC08DRAFT_728791 [Agrocybe pediades]
MAHCNSSLQFWMGMTPYAVRLRATESLAPSQYHQSSFGNTMSIRAFENLLHELSLLGVSAFSYSSEALTEARKAGVIFVDPEHLTGKEWRNIADSPTFRANGFSATVDEVHLIK